MMAIKHLHLTFVILSGFGFALRGAWMMMDSPLLQAKITRILPHVVDTGLLISAVWLAIVLKLNPADHLWLLTKIVLLVVYIVLGTLALKPVRPKTVRVGCFAAALVVFFYIVSVAFSKSPMGFFA